MHIIADCDKINYTRVRLKEGMVVKMEYAKLSADEMVERYKAEVVRLSSYIPWFEAKRNTYQQEYYQHTDSGKATMAVPTYESTLLRFVKEVQSNPLLDRNYPYIYSRYGLRGVPDEWKLIQQAKLEQMDVLYAILSRYVLKGQTKGIVWTEGVQQEIFLRVILKMQSLIAFHEGLSTS